MSKRPSKSPAEGPKTPEGFGEAPQKPLSGTPLSGPISDWAAEIAEEAAKPAPRKAAAKKSGPKTEKPAKSARGHVDRQGGQCP